MVDRKGPIISHPTYVSFGENNHYFVGVNQFHDGSRTDIIITKISGDPSSLKHKTFFSTQDFDLDAIVDAGLVIGEIEGRKNIKRYSRIKDGEDNNLGKELQKNHEQSLTLLYANLRNLEIRYEPYKKAV